ncbi:MAG TPA: glycosyltransferase family 2 protein [Blastocatellia bacterium]|nr:glycosyltransferase family 2 protein [Blastocatellia bacterium]
MSQTQAAISPRSSTATLVIPCLNEAGTLRDFLRECKEAFSNDKETDWEILVADNGSIDGSADIAVDEGARVISVACEGYGSALHSGILAARDGYVVYADADGTYSPADAVRLLAEIRRSGADLVVGTRILGEIEEGAMPWLHRYLGTPVLSFLVRWLYAIPITDCNSGIRCLRRETYASWRLSGDGMEYASAMLIHAASAGATVKEIPVTLRRSPNHRIPHLKIWRDGMRHLLTILAGAPGIFWHPGIAMLVLSLALTVPCFWGLIQVADGVQFFGPHTQAISIVIGFYGAAFMGVALSLYNQPRHRKPIPKLAMALTTLREDVLFWALIGFFTCFLAGGVYAFWQWSRIHYSDFAFLKFTLGLIYFTLVPAAVSLGVFQSHLQKRTL